MLPLLPILLLIVTRLAAMGATAKPVLEEALKKFETFKPASSLHPHWGKSQTEGLIAACK